MHDSGLIIDAPMARRTEASALPASPGGPRLGPTWARGTARTAPGPGEPALP